jgi:Intracellular proteinase inhibitor
MCERTPARTLPVSSIRVLTMNTRILIPLLLAGAVALACGSRSRADATTKPATRGVRQAGLLMAAPAKSVAKRDDAPATAVAAPLKSAFIVRAEARAIHFSLDLTNATKKNLELEFPSGQEYDFAVIDSTGREVYRWGKERMFTQSLQNRLLDGGETMRFEEHAEQSLPNGSYIAVATLRSTNYPVQERVPFRLQ